MLDVRKGLKSREHSQHNHLLGVSLDFPMPETTCKSIDKNISNGIGGLTSIELDYPSSSDAYNRHLTSEFYRRLLLVKGPPYYNLLGTVEPSILTAR